MDNSQRDLKKHIRKEVMAVRKALSIDEATKKSDDVMDNLIKSGLLDGYDHIMAFMDFRNEVQTERIINHIWSLGKSVYIPLVDNDTMTITIHRISDLEDMSISSFGIREPNPKKTPAVDPQVVELILAPGVAFDASGYRIGYGAGMYDKMLAMIEKKPVVAALSFELQMVPSVPHESHDVKMDYIITEKKVYDCR
jgi:5-formyltetrahydrofolate cyclo-ligase